MGENLIKKSPEDLEKLENLGFTTFYPFNCSLCLDDNIKNLLESSGVYVLRRTKEVEYSTGKSSRIVKFGSTKRSFKKRIDDYLGIEPSSFRKEVSHKQTAWKVCHFMSYHGGEELEIAFLIKQLLIEKSSDETSYETWLNRKFEKFFDKRPLLEGVGGDRKKSNESICRYMRWCIDQWIKNGFKNTSKQVKDYHELEKISIKELEVLEKFIVIYVQNPENTEIPTKEHNQLRLLFPEWL